MEQKPDVLNALEAAGFLRISEKTLRDLASRGEIPCRRIGREYRFSRTKMLDWLAGASVRTR